MWVYLMVMKHTSALNVLTGGVVALAAAQVAGHMAGFASAYYEEALAMLAAPLIGLAAGLGGWIGSGYRRGRALQAVSALAAMSGCMVAIYMWLYACERNALYRATRIDQLPPSALFFGPDLKFQWKLWWIFLRTGGFFLIAWILAGAVAATTVTGEPFYTGHGRAVAGACVLAFLVGFLGWKPLTKLNRLHIEDENPRTFEAAWMRLNANPLALFIDAVERRMR